MDQPVPDVSGEDVIRVVRRDFGLDRLDAVMGILSEYGAEEWQRERHRVRLAVLKLASGNMDALRSHIETAKCDYRDVLAYAEYPGYMKLVPPSGKTAEQRRQDIIRSDWDQYRSWLNRK